MAWNSTDRSLFYSRNDPNDPRLGDLVKTLKFTTDLTKDSYVIGGYPDDEGVQINLGRVGASKGPDMIRKYLYKMTPPLDRPFPAVFDYGNLDVQTTLAERHEIAKSTVTHVLMKGGRWIGFGGGHDYGYPDGAGFLEWARGLEVKPLILNFDAHLDVRPTDKGFSSGTPFFRLLSDYPALFDFVEIGIQSQCNSQVHLNWAVERGAKVLSWESFQASEKDLLSFMVDELQEEFLRPRPTFVSIDIDAFSSAYAPGCSQSFATGFEPREVLKALNFIAKRMDIRVASIYEVAPPLDQDNRTARLAAQLAYTILR